MVPLPRIVNVQHLQARVLRVRFDDGLTRDLDFAGTLDGVLETIDDDEAFGRVFVDDASGTITWPGGLDLDPDVLHGDHPPASGGAPTVLQEHRPQTTRQTTPGLDLAHRFQQLPVLDRRAADEILGYADDGLPT